MVSIYMRSRWAEDLNLKPNSFFSWLQTSFLCPTSSCTSMYSSISLIQWISVEIFIHVCKYDEFPELKFLILTTPQFPLKKKRGIILSHFSQYHLSIPTRFPKPWPKLSIISNFDIWPICLMRNDTLLFSDLLEILKGGWIIFMNLSAVMDDLLAFMLLMFFCWLLELLEVRYFSTMK